MGAKGQALSDISGFVNEKGVLIGNELVMKLADDADGDLVSDDDDAFPDDPAASIDSDGDGAPDEWSAYASDDEIDASHLQLDAFLFDPAASVDSDSDGSPDEWNEDATDADIEASDLVLDQFLRIQMKASIRMRMVWATMRITTMTMTVCRIVSSRQWSRPA